MSCVRRWRFLVTGSIEFRDGETYHLGNSVYAEIIETVERRKLRLTMGTHATAMSGVALDNDMFTKLILDLARWLDGS